MISIGEDLILHGQESASGVHEIDAREAILSRDLLGSQMLLYGHRVIGPALDRRIVGDDHAQSSAHRADPGDDPGGRCLIVVHPLGSEWGDLEERGALVEQGFDAIPREQFAAADVALARGRRAPCRGPLPASGKVGKEFFVGRAVLTRIGHRSGARRSHGASHERIGQRVNDRSQYAQADSRARHSGPYFPGSVDAGVGEPGQGHRSQESGHSRARQPGAVRSRVDQSEGGVHGCQRILFGQFRSNIAQR